MSCKSFLFFVSLKFQLAQVLRQIYIWQTFSPILTCFFIFLIAFCKEQTLKIFMKSSLSNFSFMIFAFCVLSKESWLIPMLQRSFVFTSRSLIVVAFTFGSVMHFLVVCGVRQGGGMCSFPYLDIQLFQHHPLNRLPFLLNCLGILRYHFRGLAFLKMQANPVICHTFLK